MHPKLSILIATTEERRGMYYELMTEFENQIKAEEYNNGSVLIDSSLSTWRNCTGKDVEVISVSDNKGISIGRKRQVLLDMAVGEWVVFFDDDDWPASNYVELILSNMSDSVDCMGIKVKMTTNGLNEQTCLHRLGRPWAESKEGYDYIRPIIHFNPVRRELALQAGFRDMRFGEDRDYADRLNRLVRNEVFIDEWLFHYRYTTKQPHNEKYGVVQRGGRHGRKR